jgi:hypothetical protein
MNQETVAGTEAPSEEAPPPASTAPVSAKKLPPWLPFFALATVPALIVGILVYALAGDSGSGGASGVLDGFIRLGNPPENVLSYTGELPPEFPDTFPIYEGSDIHVAFSILSEENNGVSYFVVLRTGDSPEEVYDFYLNQLGEDPWQVEIARSSPEFTGVRFTSPEDADVVGDVTLHFSELDEQTSIYVSFQDLTPSGAQRPEEVPFVLGASRPLPPTFPNDIPLYESNRDQTIVTDTYFERAPGGTSYIISFLTKDSQDDVIDSYTEEFQRRGWQVTSSEQGNQGFALSIDFTDGPQEQVQGSIQTDAFENDPSYTKVDLLLQVSSNRSRGN